MVDANIATVSPGRSAGDPAVPRRPREAGLWQPLCEAALWQPPAFDGTPMHSETSAQAAILSHTGERWNRARPLARGARWSGTTVSRGPACRLRMRLRHCGIVDLNSWLRRSGGTATQ